MKIFISADMEGVAGVVHDEHTVRDGREHDRARMLMTEEVNACIRGALAKGAKEIVVGDSHGTMRNIYPEYLHENAELISGSPKMLGMMDGIDETYDAAIFLGYHTKRGSTGILNHSYNGRVRSIKVNDVEYGEFGLNAMIAGFYQVPVLCVSGCNNLMKEARELIPSICTAEVKQTINENTAKNLHPKRARTLIEKKTKEAFMNMDSVKPFVLRGRASVELSFNATSHAEKAAFFPTVKQIDPLTIMFTSNDIIECYRYISSLIKIAI